jgi:hypothetical protein
MSTDDWIERMEMEEKIEQAGSITLDRLQLLVQGGYQPDFGGEEQLGAIWLYHPRESFKHKQLLLYGSGLVISLSAKSDEHHFGREETEAFKRFLKTVPIPSLWERTRRARVNAYAWLFICGVMFGSGIASIAAMEFVKAFLRNSPPN